MKHISHENDGSSFAFALNCAHGTLHLILFRRFSSVFDQKTVRSCVFAWRAVHLIRRKSEENELDSTREKKHEKVESNLWVIKQVNNRIEFS